MWAVLRLEVFSFSLHSQLLSFSVPLPASDKSGASKRKKIGAPSCQIINTVTLKDFKGLRGRICQTELVTEPLL